MNKKLSKFSDEDAVLIYQMGKVGSSALEVSLDNCLHFHNLFLNPPNPPHYKLLYPGRIAKLKYSASLMLKRRFLSARDEVKIITLTRCPFERNVSMFFQAFPFWMAEYYSGFGDLLKAHNNREEGLEVVWDCFKRNFNHEYSFNWFEVELKRFSGVDIFKKSRPVDSGYSYYKNGKFNILLVEMDRINELGPIIEEFSGQEMRKTTSNSGEKKWYRDVYRSFRKEYLEAYKNEFSYLKDTRYGEWYFEN